MSSKNLTVSRRQWRRLLVDKWGKPDEPGGKPWFGQGASCST